MDTNVYIDGYNLYYGRLKHTPYKWLNPDLNEVKLNNSINNIINTDNTSDNITVTPY